MLEIIIRNFTPNLIIYNSQTVFKCFLLPIKVRQSWHDAQKFCILNGAYLQGQQGFRFASRDSCMVNIVVRVPPWVNEESQQVYLESDSPPFLDIYIYRLNHPSELLSLPSICRQLLNQHNWFKPNTGLLGSYSWMRQIHPENPYWIWKENLNWLFSDWEQSCPSNILDVVHYTLIN